MAKNKIIIPILFVILLSLFSYLNIFRNEFVWDDHVYILDNGDIRSVSNVKLFFTQDVDGLYRPLRSMHYALVYSIAGKNELLYHLNSIFLHTLVSIIVFLIVFEIANKKAALLASLIFAAHPIHTERVANITAGFDLLGIFFMLLSFYLYIKFTKSNNKKYFLFSLFLFIIALFSSEEAIVLPLLIVLYELCFNRDEFIKKLKNKIIKNYLAFFIAALVYAVLRFFILGIKGRIEGYLAGSFYLTMLTMPKVFVYYIYLLIFPANLALFHDIKAASSFFEPEVLISLVILATIIFLTLKFYRNKVLFFSVFWFFIALLPFSNLVPLQVFMAERYLYVPSIAFSFLVSYFLFAAYNKFKNKKIRRYGVIFFIILLLIFYSGRTIARNADWKNDLTLWSRTVETNPGSSRAHDNLGFTYERMGDNEKALEEFKTAVGLQPNDYRALANLGVAYAKIEAYNESIAALEKSIGIKRYHKTYDKLGLVYAEIGAEEKAIEQFKEATKIEPRYSKAHNDLATVYGRLGEFDLALQEFNEAIRIDKDYADAHYNLGILLEFLKQNDLAKKEFETALSLEPDNGLYRKKVKI
ncbi:tetratricopeptide repeat protein [Candidatus Woesearchaeota archaeon]|nr:tetratricopeptide repeat protein [Candidatus Woesearchaeota archaeon]